MLNVGHSVAWLKRWDRPGVVTGQIIKGLCFLSQRKSSVNKVVSPIFSDVIILVFLKGGSGYSVESRFEEGKTKVKRKLLRYSCSEDSVRSEYPIKVFSK